MDLKTLPKIELHAHLSGSISQEYLANKNQTFRGVDVVASQSLAECFEYFKEVGRVIVDLETLEDAARHVLSDFAEEGCIYLELRTTPKAFGGMSTERDYVATIERVSSEFSGSMDVKLLLSIDRGKIHSKQMARERVANLRELAAAFPSFVVGFDVCGDPRAKTIELVLDAVEENGLELPITVHTGEMRDDDEVELILSKAERLGIKRLGHCCFVPDDTFGGRDFGVEICPTSNQVAMRIPDLECHHFKTMRKHPNLKLSINTDDRGLFNCSLTSELRRMAEAFDLTSDDLIQLQRSAILSSFHPSSKDLLATFELELLKRKCRANNHP